MAERVQKVLAAAGVASRRVCERLIADGRVTVDGDVVTLGDRVDPGSQVVAVDGERVHVDATLAYTLMNKPAGYVTTASDPQGRPTVMDLVPPNPRIYPVGRLDRETEGLLLLTNDGELAHRLTHPRYEVEKVYLAEVLAPVRASAVRALEKGVVLDDGPARARRAQVLHRTRDRALLEVTLTEGRNREVRRMLAAVGVSLLRLARVRMGPLRLGEIGGGKLRPLTSREVSDLYRAVDLGAAPTRHAPPTGGRE